MDLVVFFYDLFIVSTLNDLNIILYYNVLMYVYLELLTLK